jgi:hypothetical protein
MDGSDGTRTARLDSSDTACQIVGTALFALKLMRHCNTSCSPVSPYGTGCFAQLRTKNLVPDHEDDLAQEGARAAVAGRFRQSSSSCVVRWRLWKE